MAESVQILTEDGQDMLTEDGQAMFTEGSEFVDGGPAHTPVNATLRIGIAVAAELQVGISVQDDLEI